MTAAAIRLAMLAALLLGVVLVVFGQAMRRRRGLGPGRTVSLDRLVLTSVRLGLTGRPDRLIKSNGSITVEEWKSGRRVRDSHRAQMGVYFVLVEEELRVRPAYGVIVLGDGTRHRIENTEGLRKWVLELAEAIRAARAAVDQANSVDPTPGQCRACGVMDHADSADHSGH